MEERGNNTYLIGQSVLIYYIIYFYIAAILYI